MSSITITKALEDLTSDILWVPLQSDPAATAALEAARNTTVNTLANLESFAGEVPIHLSLGEISVEESERQLLAFGGRKRGALKFLRLIENRQADMRGATVTQLRAAITRHREDAADSGDQPGDYDLELWEQVAA